MSAPRLGRRGTVRGTARRIVIVPQPDGGAFEQAIFIVRGECSVSESELLREAMEAAQAEPSPRPPTQRSGLRCRFRRAVPWLIALAVVIAAAVALLLAL